MKTLYFDCSMGAAGDMIVAALLEIHPNPDDFIQRFNHIFESLHDSKIQIIKDITSRCGIQSTHVNMKLLLSDNDQWIEEAVDDVDDNHHHEHVHHFHHEHEHDHDHHHCCHHEHEHDHDHHHCCHHEHEHDHHHCCHHEHDHHHGMSIHDIHEILHHLSFNDRIQDHVLSIFNIIADAESKAHGCPIEQVHFHEVGQLDALADIVAACMLIDELAPEQILSSPVCVGFGHVHCAHGILPVPAPATVNILQDIPIFPGHIGKEMTTPTGAAILKHYASSFDTFPSMAIHRIGLGAGSRDFDTAPNILRVLFGNSQNLPLSQDLIELRVNVDDMTGEQIGYAIDLLMNEGACDAWTAPIYMKKSRPAYLITCLIHAQDKDKFVHLMFKHTTSLGVRSFACDRFVLDRKSECIDTNLGRVHRKHSEGFGTSHTKWEYNDIAEIAHRMNLSIEEVISKLNS